MSPLKVPDHLPELVRTTFSKAKANGDVNFYPTQVAVLTPNSTPFQLRFSPSLANKPKPPSNNKGSSSDKPFNPFATPPPALTITPVGPNHILVLNKFAIVPEHSILITRAFKSQLHLLDAEDLAATYACIRAYHDYKVDSEGGGKVEGASEGLFAFFNCGEHSGASQHHRHLQLLPVARMSDGLEENVQERERPWGVLADQLVAGKGEGEGTAAPKLLPFVTFAERIGEDMDPAALRAVYLRLYRKACAAAGAGGDAAPSGDDDDNNNDDKEMSASDGVEATISYNLAMTRTTMVVCPRTAEGAVIVTAEGKGVGKLALNGTVLAGTALVKNQAEWDALRQDPGQLWDILGRIGVGTASRPG